MVIKSFEDILAWQKSRELSLETYKMFKECRDYSFRDQIQRASVSVMNNIAEGYERNGNKEFRNFLYISKGSCAEVRSMIYLALDLKYINIEQAESVSKMSLSISRMLSGLIKTL